VRSFAAANSYLEATVSSVLAGTYPPLTLACRYFMPKEAPRSNQALVSIRTDDTADLAVHDARDLGVNLLLAHQRNSSANQYSGAVLGDAEDRMCIAVGRLVSNTSRLAYLNGLADTNGAGAGSNVTATTIYIGLDSVTDAGYFAGLMDWVAVYDSDLGNTNCLNLSSGAVTPQSLTPKLFWDFQTPSLKDSVGGITLTNHNTTFIGPIAWLKG
jgi:hypothetical protein